MATNDMQQFFESVGIDRKFPRLLEYETLMDVWKIATPQEMVCLCNLIYVRAENPSTMFSRLVAIINITQIYHYCQAAQEMTSKAAEAYRLITANHMQNYETLCSKLHEMTDMIYNELSDELKDSVLSQNDWSATEPQKKALLLDIRNFAPLNMVMPTYNEVIEEMKSRLF